MTAYVKFLARSAAGSVMLLALAAAPAAAQAPASATPAVTAAQSAFLGATFAQVVRAREIWITTWTGSRLKVRVVGVEATGLTVTETSGQGQTIRFEDIARMQKVTHRLRNHMITGLSIGGGFGLLGAAFCDGDPGCASAIFLTYAGIGVGIGALNGAIRNNLNRDDDLIYEARPRTTTTMALAPILSRTRKGVAFSMTWR